LEVVVVVRAATGKVAVVGPRSSHERRKEERIEVQMNKPFKRDHDYLYFLELCYVQTSIFFMAEKIATQTHFGDPTLINFERLPMGRGTGLHQPTPQWTNIKCKLVIIYLYNFKVV
jgi:hypothetical protein